MKEMNAVLEILLVRYIPVSVDQDYIVNYDKIATSTDSVEEVRYFFKYIFSLSNAILVKSLDKFDKNKL